MPGEPSVMEVQNESDEATELSPNEASAPYQQADDAMAHSGHSPRGSTVGGKMPPRRRILRPLSRTNSSPLPLGFSVALQQVCFFSYYLRFLLPCLYRNYISFLLYSSTICLAEFVPRHIFVPLVIRIKLELGDISANVFIYLNSSMKF